MHTLEAKVMQYIKIPQLICYGMLTFCGISLVFQPPAFSSSSLPDLAGSEIMLSFQLGDVGDLD